MRIVTLTSDFGSRDYYTGQLRGTLLSHASGITLVDITHEIDKFDIVQAAFVFRNAYRSFPDGTIHLLCIHHRHTSQDILCLSRSGHHFIAPDNGILSLIFDEIDSAVRITSESNGTSWKAAMASTVAGLIKGVPDHEMGTVVADFDRKIHLKPVVTNAYIKGAAIYIDGYENIVFNITKVLFGQVQKGRTFELYYKRHEPVTHIHQHYHDAPVGEVVCIFNHAGFLELGINMGKAASLLGFKIDDIIQIHFAD